MAEKDLEKDDPMEFVGVALPGDTTDAMAEVLVEEYVKMGMPDDEIFRLFQDPFYAGTHAVYRARGEAYVRELIQRVRSAWGGLGFRGPT